MSLQKGKSKEVISKNIKTLVQEDKPQNRAVAIAYSQASKTNKERKK